MVHTALAIAVRYYAWFETAPPRLTDIPVTETQKHSAYPGCYALSKVLEEVMLEQYYIQYDLNGCCLRAPWIMEKDDFKYQLSFGEAVFGGPRWIDLVGPAQAAGTTLEEKKP